MFKANENYLKLPGSYLFSTVGRKQREYSAAHPDKKVIRLSIGDVTQPLAPAIIERLHKAALFVVPDGKLLADKLYEAGYEASVIGHLTEKSDRVVVHDDERRFLTPPRFL